MCNKFWIVLMTILLGSVLAREPVHSATYYVATTGADTNAGSIASPWRTITKAVNTMVAGDTTYVRGGTYVEASSVVFTKSGTSSAPIRLLNYPNEAPVLTWANKTNENHLIIINTYSNRLKTVSWIHIEGLEISGGALAIKFWSATDITLRRLIIRNHNHSTLSGRALRVTVDRCIFANNGHSSTTGYGIYATGQYWRITNNLFYDNHNGGIQMYGEAFDASVTPSNEFVLGQYWLVANNTFAYQRAGFGLVIWTPYAKDSRIENNIFYENAQSRASSDPQGIWFKSPGAGHVLKNNIFYATTPGGTLPIGGTPGNWYTETGRIEADPLFVNGPATLPGSANFQLRVGSPSINRGISVPEIQTDFVGVSRPQGSGYDIGAYELLSNTAPTPPLNLSVK